MATRKPKVESTEETKPVKKAPAAKKTTGVKKVSTAETKSAKQIADENGEPYVSIISIELDPDNIGNGAFELDWNDTFIIKLVRAGYQSKTNEEDSVIVDRWFQTVCKNIAMETFEQWESNQPYDARPRVIDRKNLGDGRSEAS
jgi:hypothetical protein